MKIPSETKSTVLTYKLDCIALEKDIFNLIHSMSFNNLGVNTYDLENSLENLNK